MRRTLGTLALLLALVGCGDEDAPDVGEPVECDANADCAYPPVLVSATAGEGEVSTEPTVLETQADVSAYVEQFSDDLAAEVTRAVEKVQLLPDWVVGAAVVSIGCDVPPGAEVKRVADGVEITPQKVAKPMQECFAPVTTVALAPVPAP